MSPPISSTPDPLPLAQLEDQIQTLLKEWDRSGTATVLAWAGFRLIQSIRLEQSLDDTQAARALVRYMLAQLKTEHPDLADLLDCRYFKGETVNKIGDRHHWSVATTYRKQKQAITRLAELIRQGELEARTLAADTAQSRLPLLPSQQLFGVESALTRLRALVHDPESNLILVDGIGGIGKTALVHALMQQEFQQRHFVDFGWVSAQQRSFDADTVLGSQAPPAHPARPALTATALIEALAAQLITGHNFFSSTQAAQALAERLRQIPHLIVIDNLETVVDVESLLPTLSRLAGAGKFVLTSRESLRDQAGVHHFHVPELDEVDALALVRYEARRHNLPQVAAAPHPELAPLFAAVGGNPLALRLVVGQLHLLTITQAVEDLHEARGRRAEALYFYIYRQAWMRLGADEQDTLLLMPLFAQSGADLETLVGLSDLGRGLLVGALHTLARLNLVNVGGSLHSRRFSIHRLTESFLRKEVIRWQAEAQEMPPS
ncbi:MAG: ATP-binding protein [Caldilineaceae bacterium]|nr:ATP-binding protein [Caldilineaceae bacterium]MBP8109961.1 ATP-binding protein [Caldilineaceae bacterium]MBP8122319.1 ATP-binding protein [Caldilineaceae bacterium]MBP9072677.1 ATP-binding protein [Caldilineaceae bacterium]